MTAARASVVTAKVFEMRAHSVDRFLVGPYGTSALQAPKFGPRCHGKCVGDGYGLPAPIQLCFAAVSVICHSTTLVSDAVCLKPCLMPFTIFKSQFEPFP